MWNVYIRLWADVETDFSHDKRSNDFIDADFKRILEIIDLTDMESLENEIFQELRFQLCKDCRDIFKANPLNIPLDDSRRTR